MSAVDSQQILSDRDDVFFDEIQETKCINTQLSLRQLYSYNALRKYVYFYADNMQDGLVSAEKIIDSILNQMDDDIDERAIQKGIVPLSINNQFKIINNVIESMDLRLDDLDNHVHEDEEPGQIIIEKWIRNEINVTIVQRQQEEKCASAQSLFKTPTIENVPVRKKLKIVAEDKPNQPFYCGQDEEDDFQIQQLRNYKQNQSNQKEQEELKFKKQQADLNKLKKEENKKDGKQKYTFDYEGNRMSVKNIVKFPDTHTFSKYNINEQNDQLKNAFTISEAEQQTAIKQKKNAENRFSVINPPLNLDTKLPRQYFSFNEFLPSHGVTLYYNNNVKEGPVSHMERIDTLEDLESKLKILGPNQAMHITKSEYKRLTEKGNLQMAATLFKNQPHGQLSKQNTLTFDPMKAVGEQAVSETKFNLQLSKNQIRINKKSDNNSQIKVNKPNLTKSIQLTEEEIQEDNYQLNNLKLPGLNKKIDPSKMLSPNDDFNQKILRQADWGKKNASSNTNALTPSNVMKHKTEPQDMRSTLNTIYKIPRERDLGTKIKISKTLGWNTKSQDLNNVGFRGTFYSMTSKFSDTLRSQKNV